MKEWKRYYLIRIILTTLFFIGFGGLFLVFRRYAVDVFDVLLIAMGLMSVVINLPRFIYSLLHVKCRGEWVNLVLEVAAIVLGVLLTLLRRDALLLVLGIFSIALPALRIAFVKDRATQLKKEILPMLFGCFMLFVSFAEMEETVFAVFGVALLGSAILYLAIGLIAMRRRFAKYQSQAADTSEEK